MIEGTLTVNLDPPFIWFDTTSDGAKRHCHHECTSGDIRLILLELAGESVPWPVKECVVRSSGTFSVEMLHKFQLLQLQDNSNE